MRLTMVGHSAVLIELDGVTFLTDPLLRDRVLFLRAVPGNRYRPPAGGIDVVLLSHFHLDHYDPGSLALLDPSVRVVGPPRTRLRLRRRGFANVTELRPGDEAAVGSVTVTATRAEHGRFPALFRTTPLGFVVRGSAVGYFAGDTDLFPELAAIGRAALDVALLPIGGWGPTLGAGHMDPGRAVEALRLLRPRYAVPIHYGVLRPIWLGRLTPRYLTEPGTLFARLAAEAVPEVEVRLLEPGQSLDVPPREAVRASSRAGAPPATP